MTSPLSPLEDERLSPPDERAPRPTPLKTPVKTLAELGISEQVAELLLLAPGVDRVLH